MIEVQKPVPEVRPEKVTPLKPSEAMRLGRMLYPQRARVAMSLTTTDGIAVCAIGAAMVGYGWNPAESEVGAYFPFKRRFAAPLEDATGSFSRVCPAPKCREQDPTDHIVWHLNDQHDWPTECIADWFKEIGL